MHHRRAGACARLRSGVRSGAPKASLIPDTEFAEIEELLLCTEQGGENFYVWALLRLAYVQCKYISGLSALTPEQTASGCLDALYPLIGEDDVQEGRAAVESFLENTMIRRYATEEERKRMMWALQPALFAAMYNETRGAASLFDRLLRRLLRAY